MFFWAQCPFFCLKEDKIISSTNNNPSQKKPPKDDVLLNENIRFPQVLVIDNENNQLGVMSRYDALRAAQERNLDLFCVAPQAQPPVCRILDFGKYRFQQQKKQKEARKNQHIVVVKEVQLTPQIGDHDLQTKARKSREFLEAGNKLLIKLRFRGRQMAHQEIGVDTMNRFISNLGDSEGYVIEKPPLQEGYYLNCVIAPKSKK